MTEVLTRTEQPQDQNDNDDFNSPETSGEFFIDPKVGAELYKVVEAHGQITKRSSGYKQLHADDGQNILLATAYKTTGHEATGVSKIFHAVIFSKEQQGITTAISIPLAIGGPVVTKSQKGPNGSGWPQIYELSPAEAETEIASMIKLMAHGLSKAALEMANPAESPV